MTPIVIPTFFSIPEFAKCRFSALKVDWSEVPSELAGFKKEQEYQKSLISNAHSLSERPLDLAYLRKVNEVREGFFRDSNCIPHEQKLSLMFELVIKEAVAIDKNIIYQAYLKMQQEELGSFTGFLLALPVKISLIGKPSEVVRDLAINEANSITLRRAILSCLILEKLLEHRSGNAQTSSVDLN